MCNKQETGQCTLLRWGGWDYLGVGEWALHQNRVVLDRRGFGGEIEELAVTEVDESTEQLVVPPEAGQRRDADFNLSGRNKINSK